jgi:hypothetical protein
LLMAGYKWCILRDDDRIKDAIRYRISTLRLTQTKVAKMAKIRPSQINDYLNKHDEPRHRVTQEQLDRKSVV